MPRNAAGTYALPATVNPVVGHTLGTSNWANATMNDLAGEMTDSLDRSGKGGMLAPLTLVDGTVGAPALAFTSESGTGLYRPAASQVALVVAGVQRVRVASLAAADAGIDVILNTPVTRTAGFLLDVSNNGVTQMSLGFSGILRLAGGAGGSLHTVGVSAGDATNSALTFLGNRAAADAGADIILAGIATRTAGLLLDVQNGGVSQFQVDFAGNLNLMPAGTPALVAKGTNAGLAFWGNKAAADAGADVVIRSTVTRTAGSVLDIQNNGASLLRIAAAGQVVLGGSNQTIQAGAVNAQLFGGAVAADAGTDWIITSGVTRTAGNLLDVRNNGSSRVAVSFNGTLLLSATPNVAANVANASLGLYGNRSAADTGADVILAGQVTRTAGDLLAIQNNGTLKVRVDFNGTLVTVGGSGLIQQGTNASLALVGNRSAADAGADVVANSTATRTAGLLLDVQNSGASKFSVDFGGSVNVVGTLTAAGLSAPNVAKGFAYLTCGAAGAVTVSHGNNVTSASYSTTVLTVNVSPALPDTVTPILVAANGALPVGVAYVSADSIAAGRTQFFIVMRDAAGNGVNFASGNKFAVAIFY